MVTNKFLNSYSDGRDNTKATQIPPLNSPRVRILCHWGDIRTLAIRKIILPIDYDDSRYHYYGNWNYIIKTHIPIDCNENKENNGIPTRKNKMLIVIILNNPSTHIK
jgi:hypothetical protein